MNVPSRISNQNTTIRIFLEHLLQFCLGKCGIVWQPDTGSSQVECTFILFDHTIGNEVMNTCFVFEEKVQEYIEIIWNYILHLPDHVDSQTLADKLSEVSLNLYRSHNAIENTYIFLAVMVDVSIKCAYNNKLQLLQDLVCIMPSILNSRLPNGFLRNFNFFSMYAHHHSKVIQRKLRIL